MTGREPQSEAREIPHGDEGPATAPAAAPEATPVETRRHRTSRRTGVLIALAVIGAVGLVALLAALSAHAVTANSDSATVVLEGKAIVHGNVTLSGWSLSLDSFWSVDAVFYALGVAILGLTPVHVTLVPAVIGFLVIAVGAFAARDGVRGKGALVAVLVVLSLLGLPSHALAFFFLQGPWHIGTALYCLVAFVGLRHGRFGWGYVSAVVFLVAGMLGDLQTVAFGVVPVALGGLVAMARERNWRSGMNELSAAAASVVAAIVIRAITAHLGAYSFHESHHTASLARMVSDLRHLGSWGLALLGVTHGPFGGPAIPAPVAVAHGIGALVVLAGGLVAFVGMIRGVISGRAAESGTWRLDDLLVLGCLGDLAVFELLTLSNNVEYARYLTAALIFGVIVAARVLGRSIDHLPRGALGRAVAAVSVASICAFAAEAGIELATPGPVEPVAALDQFLIGHGLTHGVGDYWAASVVTVDTHGAVTVRPIVANLHHVLVADGRQADSAWYVGQHFQFLVYERLPYGRVEASTVANTFGQPVHTYTVGSYFVDVWGHPLTLPPGQFP